MTGDARRVIDITGEIESDKAISGSAEGGDDLRAVMEKHWKLLDGDFDACDVVVVANAELTQAGAGEGIFRCFDLREQFGGNGRAGGDATG